MVDWLIVGQASGSGDTQILVKATPNTERDDRDTNLILSGITKSITIPVTQAPSDENKYLTFKILSDGDVGFYDSDYTDTPPFIEIQYSKNGGEWVRIIAQFEGYTPQINVVAGDEIRFKGYNPSYYEAYFTEEHKPFRCHFRTTAYFNVEGNIMSLVYGDTSSDILTSENNFRMLFTQNRIVSAEKLVLPSKTLTYGCYCGMFMGCTSLTTPPELPATSLAEGCYSTMFMGCTSLTTPPELPATTLADSCYSQMFDSCTGLTTAPELTATTLARRCYYWMFIHCSNLNYIKCLAIDISAFDCTYHWLDDVSSSGTFIKNVNMISWPSGSSGIPTGWTVEDAT